MKVNSTKSKKLKIQNKGKFPLQVTVGTLAPPFTVTSGGGTFTLAKKKSDTVTVKFQPTATGATSPQTLVITRPFQASDERRDRERLRQVLESQNPHRFLRPTKRETHGGFHISFLVMPTHAVVVGGSLAGLCAARVLADFFDHVTIVSATLIRTASPIAPGCLSGRAASITT